MIFLLDTNIASELRKPKPHGAVLAWYAAHASSAYAIPSIAIYEMQVGIEILRKRNSPKLPELEGWLNSLIETATILPLNAAAARETAKLVHGRSLDLLEDAMIAAIAKTNRLTIATRNTADFKIFGVSLVNPFEYPRR